MLTIEESQFIKKIILGIAWFLFICGSCNLLPRLAAGLYNPNAVVTFAFSDPIWSKDENEIRFCAFVPEQKIFVLDITTKDVTELPFNENDVCDTFSNPLTNTKNIPSSFQSKIKHVTYSPSQKYTAIVTNEEEKSILLLGKFENNKFYVLDGMGNTKVVLDKGDIIGIEILDIVILLMTFPSLAILIILSRKNCLFIFILLSFFTLYVISYVLYGFR